MVVCPEGVWGMPPATRRARVMGADDVWGVQIVLRRSEAGHLGEFAKRKEAEFEEKRRNEDKAERFRVLAVRY
eukprot:COSAG01_NODE_26168_length_722_cov_0.630819_2_plen_73_part_00